MVLKLKAILAKSDLGIAFKLPAHSWGTKISSVPASTMAWAHANAEALKNKTTTDVAKCTFCSEVFTTSHAPTIAS